MPNSLTEQIAALGRKPQEIIVDRSTLDLWQQCPARARFRKADDYTDHDLHRPRLVGIAGHAVMAEYISYLVSTGQQQDLAELETMALAAPSQYQPDLLDCIKLTGRRVRLDGRQYIGHEQQVGYRLPNAGLHGEDIILTCRVDLLMWGHEPGQLWVPDWKFGWGQSGYDFQAAFYSVVVARAHEGVQSVRWQPLWFRRGSWGKPNIFEAEDLDAAEVRIKAALAEWLQDEEHLPRPGSIRCRQCEYIEGCDAAERWRNIRHDPGGYCLALEKLEAEVKLRKQARDAYLAAHGAIEADGWRWELSTQKKSASTVKTKLDDADAEPEAASE